ncbi:hypothetical protein [Magnetovibrio sp.]|uniref:hypothetical protein n=1 Tax=Magnetovibrio sp. TaxID=2024836 RepID=UPI002F93826D
MTNTPQPQKKKIKYAKALAMLGVAATVAYTTPALTLLGQAHASGGGNGGGFFSGGFFGMGGGGSGGGKGGLSGFGSGGGGFVITDQITATECGDCHMVYGPEALPQGSWRKLMGNLPNHFGEDATLDEPTRRHIENYLVSGAQPGDGPIRITEQSWFMSEHRGEVSRSSMERAKSMANCNACHRGGSNPWQRKGQN